MPLDPRYIEKIKQWEGYNPKPYWDYKQWTSGYGTRAAGPNEIIDRAEAEQRLNNELAQAERIVNRYAPDLDPGRRAALADLTFNAGTDWQKAGLGQAVKAGDWEEARRRFLQYTKAGGEDLPGLIKRRRVGANWFNGQPVDAEAPNINADVLSEPSDDMASSRSSPSRKPVWSSLEEIGDIPPASLRPASRVSSRRLGRGSMQLANNAHPYGEVPDSYVFHKENTVSPKHLFARGGHASGIDALARWSEPQSPGTPQDFEAREANGQMHAGLIDSPISGRTDELPITVEAGSFVFPADVVSALGEGNTDAGNRIIEQLFTAAQGGEIPEPIARVFPKMKASKKSTPKLYSDIDMNERGTVPIIAAGGEFVATPDMVASLAGGDVDEGHTFLDALSQAVRADAVDTLKKLPPPVR